MEEVRLIDANALLKECENKGNFYSRIVREFLLTAPTASPWIPCSERMPENRECVTFTINRECPKIGCGYRIHSERGGLLLTRWFDKLSGLNFSDYDVTAWMPLPDAYEPPKEGAENG